MIPDDAFRAEQCWMTPGERAEQTWRKAGVLLALLVALGGTLWVGAKWEGDPVFLLFHGSAAMLSLGLVSAWGAPRLRGVAAADWPAWVSAVAGGAALFLLAGLTGVLAAGSALAAWGHPRPWSLLASLDLLNLLLALGSSYALALAACGAFALVPRWQALGRGPRMKVRHFHL
ncbi:MAG: hypothetical protein HY823_14860 [Acidobacteria bacterium]|nr:hypothetical protein [Acidobacteriota bacterium]